MSKINANDLSGEKLDEAVMIALGGEKKPHKFGSNHDAPIRDAVVIPQWGGASTEFKPSEDWNICGWLINHFNVAIVQMSNKWCAFCTLGDEGMHYFDVYPDDAHGYGATPQEAICRAVIVSIAENLYENISRRIRIDP